MIAVLPACLVAAAILWQGGGEEPQPASLVAELGAELDAASTPEGLLATATPPGTPASAEATPPAGIAPTSRGIPPPELSAAAAIVVDDASLAVLYEKDAYTPRPPASVTKIATAIVAAESTPLDALVTSGLHYWELAIDGDSTTMGLEPEDILTLRELIAGLMLVSGNDAARVIAQHVAGSEEAFVARMNALAERLGMTATHFRNADGLAEPGHASSPWDLVLLSRHLMRFPDLREIVGTEQHIARGQREGQTVEFDLYNHNPLLNYTPGVDGIKTGFTEEAGRTFALTAERNGHRVYIVLLDSPLRAQDAQELLEWAYENHAWPGDEPAAPEGGTVHDAGTEPAP